MSRRNLSVIYSSKPDVHLCYIQTHFVRHRVACKHYRSEAANAAQTKGNRLYTAQINTTVARTEEVHGVKAGGIECYHTAQTRNIECQLDKSSTNSVTYSRNCLTSPCLTLSVRTEFHPLNNGWSTGICFYWATFATFITDCTLHVTE